MLIAVTQYLIMVTYWLSSLLFRTSGRLEFISGSRWSVLSHPFSSDQWALSHLWFTLKNWQAIFLLQTQRTKNKAARHRLWCMVIVKPSVCLNLMTNKIRKQHWVYRKNIFLTETDKYIYRTFSMANPEGTNTRSQGKGTPQTVF